MAISSVELWEADESTSHIYEEKLNTLDKAQSPRQLACCVMKYGPTHSLYGAG